MDIFKLVLAKHLSTGMMIDILERLPVKTLVRCMSVHKSWRSLITNPKFIAMHLKHASSLERNDHLLIVPDRRRTPQFGETRKCIVLNQTESVEHFNDLHIPLDPVSWEYDVAGSLNGLVCLSSREYPLVYLWNPSISKTKLILYDNYTEEVDKDSKVTIGFGFDHRTNDYMVIKVVYFYDVQLMTYYGKKPPQAEVYSLKMNSWKRIESVIPYISSYYLRACVNGAVYWKGGYRIIVSFTFANQVFREIQLPDDIFNGFEHNGEDDWFPTVFRGSIAILAYGRVVDELEYEDGDQVFYSRLCRVWVIEEGGERGVVTDYKITIEDRTENPIGFSNSELLVDNDGEVKAYNLDTGESKHLGVGGRDNSFSVVSFMESLLLLEGEHAKLEMAEKTGERKRSFTELEGEIAEEKGKHKHKLNEEKDEQKLHKGENAEKKGKDKEKFNEAER